MRARHLCYVWAILSGSSTIPAYGQGCCTPGSSPLGGLTGGPLRRQSVEVGVAFEGYELQQAYLGADAIDDPGGRHSRVASTLFYSRIGLHDRLAAVIQLPYEYRMREQTIVLGEARLYQKFSNAALGDLTTLLMVRALPLRPVASWAVILGAGVKWPTGPHDRTQDGRTIPVELQTGTGSTDPVVAFVGYRSWQRFALTGSVLARFPSEGETGYEYGNETQVALVALWKPSVPMNVGLELRARAAAADRFRGSERINTGGSRLMSGLRVLAELPAPRLGLEAAFLLPVLQDLNGVQLGVDGQLSLNVRWLVR